MTGITGRFAPTPSGLLHAGSLVAALGSWLDAKASGGRWLLRIDDLDAARVVAGADAAIIDQLARCGLAADEPPTWQSRRAGAYRQALATLAAAARVYPCGCSRRELATIASAPLARARGDERVYPGTCRNGLHGKMPRATRLRTDRQATGMSSTVDWVDRRLGAMRQEIESEVGDFVVARADGVPAYQLAVVVDDAADGITDVVRGEDLASNTARQIMLQRLLGLPTPRYLHLPLVRGADGEKLSKQNGATPLALATAADARAALRSAAAALGLEAPPHATVAEWLAEAVARWRAHDLHASPMAARRGH